MPDIEHGSIVSIEDLATAAREAADTIEDPENYDEDEVTEAKEFIQTLANFINQSHLGCDEEDPETVVDALGQLGRDEDSLISDGYFTEYAESLTKELGYLPDEVPWWISNHIDWDGVADDIKADYSELTLDGEKYWHRDS